MITKDQVQEQIGKLKIELATLQVRHEQAVKERNEREQQFAQIVAANQNRFQQLNGAIGQLAELLEKCNEDEPLERCNKETPQHDSRRTRLRSA